MINPFWYSSPPVPPPGGDPYFANVVLLLHGNGSDGGTTFTDSSGSAKTVTANGNIQTSTAQSKFGGSSILLDGTTDYLTLVDSDDWHMTGDFTVEFWMRPTSLTGFRDIIAQRPSNIACPWVIAQSSSALVVYISNNNASWAGSPGLNSGNILALNTWYYVAMTKSGSSWQLWVDGVQVGSTYTNGTALTNMNTTPFHIGGQPAASDFAGNLAEIRITKGTARDVSSIPTSPFPDS